MKTSRIYNYNDLENGLLVGILRDKIYWGMGLIAILSIVGSIQDSGYSMKMKNDSIDIHP